jgi:hypothetical protein
MAKKKGTTEKVLLLLALVIPLGAANFLLNIVLTVFYLPSISSSISSEVDAATRIFLPFILYLVGLAFSIVVLTAKTKEVVLTLLALLLNAILVVSGVFFIASTYLM